MALPSVAKLRSAGQPRRLFHGRLAAAYADVFESHGAKADGVQQVFGIHDEGTAKHLFDASEIEAAKFRPAGAHD